MAETENKKKKELKEDDIFRAPLDASFYETDQAWYRDAFDWIGKLFNLITLAFTDKEGDEFDRYGKAIGFFSDEPNTPWSGANPGDSVFVESLGRYMSVPFPENTKTGTGYDYGNFSGTFYEYGLNASVSRVLNFIGDIEANGNYEAMYPNTTLDGATNQTLQWVLDNKGGAVGKYQFTGVKLKEVAQELGYDLNTTLFSPQVQDTMALHVLKTDCGLDQLLIGKKSAEEFANELAKIWSSVPMSNGKSRYESATNTALTTRSAVIDMANDAKAVYNDIVRNSKFELPFGGKAISSNWGIRKDPHGSGGTDFHEGMDFAVSYKDVQSVCNGRVVYSGTSTGYGNIVIVQAIPETGVYFLYGHLDTMSVKEGALVNRGQKLGVSGETGNATGRVVHFEALVDGVAVDPQKAANQDLSNPKIREALKKDAYERANGNDPKSKVFEVRVKPQYKAKGPFLGASLDDKETRALDKQENITESFNDAKGQRVAYEAPEAESKSKRDLFRENMPGDPDKTVETPGLDKTLNTTHNV
ncbi:MAG: M23 family metallopeptidase [Alphaproteobacteria bacterium]|nr:M23 family metallopeptidase [Alphaproteobacteria bacterium]